MLDRIFHDVLGVEGPIDDETTAADIDGWDSVAHVTLMFSIEQDFGIQFVGNEFSTLDSVGELRRAIDEKLGLGPTSG